MWYLWGRRGRCDRGGYGRFAVLFLAALLATPSAQAQGRSPAAGITLRVLTWNTHTEPADRLVEAVRASGADVVALQEVDVYKERSGCRDHPSELAEQLGMQALVGANITGRDECGTGRESVYGDALLSRHPILEWRHTLLPNQGGEQRGMLEAVLQVDGQHVRVVSTHFEYASASERRAQAEAVSGQLESSPEAVVVMGDLNGTPGDGALAPMRDAFTDAWEAAGAGDGYTNPSSNPRRRIDYVFFRGLSATAARVLDSTASDHLAVRADLVS